MQWIDTVDLEIKKKRNEEINKQRKVNLTAAHISTKVALPGHQLAPSALLTVGLGRILSAIKLQTGFSQRNVFKTTNQRLGTRTEPLELTRAIASPTARCSTASWTWWRRPAGR